MQGSCTICGATGCILRFQLRCWMRPWHIQKHVDDLHQQEPRASFQTKYDMDKACRQPRATDGTDHASFAGLKLRRWRATGCMMLLRMPGPCSKKPPRVHSGHFMCCPFANTCWITKLSLSARIRSASLPTAICKKHPLVITARLGWRLHEYSYNQRKK